MERLMIPRFRVSGGKHCWTTALKNVLDWNGLDLSEEMLFGLSGGIGFIYWYMKLMPAPFIGTRYGKGIDPLLDTCKRIGAEVSVEQTSSAEKGHEELKRQLREGQPALIFVDMAYLPYLALPEKAHFGAHTVVVFGLDERRGKVCIADRCNKPVTVSTEVLKKARSSKFAPFPPKNKLLRIEYPPKISNLAGPIRESISRCCEQMLRPPIKNIGLAGIQKWADLVPKWRRQFKGMDLLGCLFNVFLYIEISGTGGGAFRKMYAEFLSQARAVLGKPALEETVGMFRDSGKMWGEVAAAALPDSWPVLGKIRRLCVRKNTLFEEQQPQALEKMLKINSELDSLMGEAAEELRGEKATELLAGLRERILQCYVIERSAVEKLDGVIK